MRSEPGLITEQHLRRTIMQPRVSLVRGREADDVFAFRSKQGPGRAPVGNRLGRRHCAAYGRGRDMRSQSLAIAAMAMADMPMPMMPSVRRVIGPPVRHASRPANQTC